ncbi:sensor histidine kinase [Cognatilysobacter bugurensis]|uniref:histidine kinase n=1 Tax=Cognatilysobacter bugurensis TaxID=543356 RepID=A0A918WAD7_9GAMM|nr:HAMP domain-containing sensor histidine kinase [Lysobacter bugurensis]GHA88728.1 sensor histidine kinase [Lysobacter bugurensis]
MAQGLPRKIKLAIIGQALVATLVISLGVLLGGIGVRQTLLHSLLRHEAETFRELQQRNPAHPLPDSAALTGYLVRGRSDGARLPAVLRDVSPGLHAFAGDDRVVFVDPDPRGTLYLVYDPFLIDRAVTWTAAVAIVLALLATYLTAWLTYRTSKRLVAPVSWLANVVSRWDPRQPDPAALAPDHLPPDSAIEVRRLAHALRGLARRVADFVQRERDFTRDASHELRTPLTVIRVATDLLAGDPELGERQRRSLGRVRRAAHDMEGVIEAFLILARESEIEPQRERLAVREIVESELERVRPLLRDKPVELRLEDDGAPELHAPRHVLHVMLGNLLVNAARYTESGQIVVRMNPECIEVRDTGIGMTSEVLGKVFDPFFRVDPDRLEGKGVGLSIVRRLGDRFGWPVTLTSAPGEGTAAAIHFPEAAAQV